MMAGGQQCVDKNLKAFRDLSLWLCNSHKKPWEYEDKARAIYDEISRCCSYINSTELESYLPNEEKVKSEFPKRKYLYLDPIEGQAYVPVLSITSDFGRSIPEVRIRLGLFFFHEEKIHAFGYRFESPEGPGNHHYYHAQLINGFDKDEPFPDGDAWLPTSCPTFPLDADNPVQLLLSLLIALYGVSYISRIKPLVDGLGQHLEKMRFQCLPELKWYRKVSISRGKKIEFHDPTDLATFKKKMRAKYPKCEITGITKEMYTQANAGQQRSTRSKK
ncbi:MAG: hypothetical protein Q8K00_03385 [Syntrophales bacterium]|nr:hypothetical protein [Syntrophales bacterium]